MIMNNNWNLCELFASSTQALQALDEAKNTSEAFCLFYEQRVNNLSAQNILVALKRYEDLLVEIRKVENYAYLLHSTHLNNEEISVFYQSVNDKVCILKKQLVFFENWLIHGKNLDMAELKNILPKGTYSWLQKLRLWQKHSLSNDLEKLFADENNVAQYWLRLYNETRASLSFTIEKKDYTEGQLMKLFSHKDENIRKLAGNALFQKYTQNRYLFALIYNAMLKGWQIDNHWHNFDYPEASANLANCIEQKDLQNMVSTVIFNNVSIPQRYYALKAKVLGKNKLSYWDRDRAYPFEQNEEQYSIEKAKNIILTAFNEFSPQFASIAQMFFDKDLIDYYPYAGKATGAYCTEPPVGVMPMVFLNYTGNLESVYMMAHELGHAVHEYLSQTQGELGREKSCAQAETASIFAEQLVFNYLLKTAIHPQKRFVMLAKRLENTILSTFRQISFHRFEHFVATERENGEVSVDKIEQAWLKYMQDYLGERVDTSELAPMWAAISHFFQSPFYVYSYCFSNCVVNALYEIYSLKKVDNFEEKYMKMLQNGGIENYREALSRFGIDASVPDFWQKGLNIAQKYLIELENLYESF